jgi:hypothetical protein
MNRSHQMQNYAQMGLFTKPLPAKELPAYPDPFDAKADINHRAKTYLQVNCAMCHVADGGGNSPMELGYRTPLEKAGIVSVSPTAPCELIESLSPTSASRSASRFAFRMAKWRRRTVSLSPWNRTG